MFSFWVVFGGVRREYWKYWILAQKCDLGQGVCTHDELHGNHKCLSGFKFYFESSTMVSCCGKWPWKTFCGSLSPVRELWNMGMQNFLVWAMWATIYREHLKRDRFWAPFWRYRWQHDELCGLQKLQWYCKTFLKLLLTCSHRGKWSLKVWQKYF